MIDTVKLREKTLALVAAKPEYVEELRKLLELDTANSTKDTLFANDSPTGRGFFSEDVHGVNWGRIGHLITLGILVKFWESNTSSCYCLADVKSVKDALEAYDKACATVEEGKYNQGEAPIIPDDIFDCIEGFDDIKTLFRLSLNAPKSFNIALIGPPASAKSLFLQEVARVRGSIYCLGSGTSKVGLSTYLIEKTPRFVLIDEIDKMNKDDYSVLLSALESGIVTEMKYGKQRTTTLLLTAYAAGNRDYTMPPEIKSRFEILHLREYTKDEFLSTGSLVLQKREGVAKELAEYITQQVYENLRGEQVDIREAVRLSRICRDRASVDNIVRIIKNYQRINLSDG